MGYATIHRGDYPECSGAALQPMVGDLKGIPRGLSVQRRQYPRGCGVDSAAATSRDTATICREPCLDASAEALFYWINAEEPGVHSTPLPLSGGSILDMSTYQDFWQKPIQEMGFLAKPWIFIRRRSSQ